MATNQAEELDSGNVGSTPVMVFWLNHLKKALDEIHQFVIYFESRSRDFRRRGYKGEELDQLQEHLESWQMVHSELNLIDRLKEAGVPILKQLRLVRKLLLENNMQSVMVILTDLPSREMSNFQKILSELKLKVVDSISTFKRDQEVFNIIIETRDSELSYNGDEIKNIDPQKAEIISELTSDKNEIGLMSNWVKNVKLFSDLVDREIKLHSEIARRSKIKAILSDVIHMLTILVTSMEELLFKISDNVYQQTLQQCSSFKYIKNEILNGGECVQAHSLIDAALLEWEVFTPRKNL